MGADTVDKPLMLMIRDTYKLWAGYMKWVAAQAGVPDSYRMVLAFLLRHPGASLKALAAHQGITTAAASQTVKEMQMTGYLQKQTDDRDQRYVKLYLTGRGEACAREIRRLLEQADAQLAARLTPEREAAIRAMMQELSQIIEKELPRCCDI